MSKNVDDPILDHEYDGIREYDNPLPGWWKLLFWGTIFFCVPYTIYFHFMEGNSIHEKFAADWDANAPETFKLKLKADSASIAELMNDDAKLSLVKEKFKTVCGACHTPAGTGIQGLGPNLTDHFWRNVTELSDIHRVLVNGVPGTAMVSQKGNLNTNELILMAAYVGSLSRNPQEGLPPDGKEIPTWPSEAQK
ncbi:MAG: cbb3-type cytochrome c oxidase N-terminal domain-containing protein [Planctomycetota bacterium]